jgi:hypothetical protein
MANNLFKSNAVALAGGDEVVLLEYTVPSPMKAYINQISIDINPASDFPFITFNWYIDGQLIPELARLNSQITTSYYPLGLEASVVVDSGRTLRVVVTSTNAAGSSDAVFASFGGVLRG